MRFTLLALLLATACARTPDPATVRAELLEADRAFAAATAARGVDGWVAWFAEDGAMYQPDTVIHGPQAIRTEMASLLNVPGNQLQWEPLEAVAGAAGDFGYTSGKFAVVVEGDTTVTGTYLTVWRRTPEGWRVVGDIGAADLDR